MIRADDSGRMNTRLRAALACLSCRSLHARCDGKIPSCNRCKEERRACQYPRSRRRRSLAYPSPSPSSDMLGAQDVLLCEAPYAIQPVAVKPCEAVPISIEMIGPLVASTPVIRTVSSDAVEQLIQDPDAHDLIGSYYHFFHKAHPFAPTKAYVWSQVDSGDVTIQSLFVAMCYVGSIYRKCGRRKDLEQLALQKTHSHQVPNLSGVVNTSEIYRVATLLLLSIVTHGQAELERSRDLLETAISLSVDIGMNRVDEVNLCQDKELAESWKRICWYLYIMESALTGDDGDLRFEPGSTFPLPCEIDASPLMTLSHFYTADFEDDSYVFSSLTYFIALVRTGRSIKRICDQSKDHLDRALVRADALLMNWKLHLPSDKQQVFTVNGEIDEVMFQSHVLFYNLQIYVHTSLASKMGGNHELLHRRRKHEAAEAAVSLLTLHPGLLQMSPLNIASLSGIAMSNVCATLYAGSDPGAEESLRLVLGVLKQLGGVWETANLEVQALKAMIRLTYAEPGSHVQEAGANVHPTSRVDALSGDAGGSVPGLSPSVGDSEDVVGLGTYETRGSLDISLPESVTESPDDSYGFTWDF